MDTPKLMGIFMVGILLILGIVIIIIYIDTDKPNQIITIKDENGKEINIKPKNVESIYNEEKQEIKISYGAIDLARVQLKTPINVYVMKGTNRLVAEFEVESYQELDNFFTDMEFYDLNKASKKVQRVFTYKYKILIGYETIPINEKVCEKEQIDTWENPCPSKIIRYDEMPIYEWRILEKSAIDKLPKGNITIGIFTEVYEGDYVDWQPTFLEDTKITQWATWTEAFNDKLLSYYALEENTTLVLDSANIFNGTRGYNTVWNKPTQVTGKHNNALRFHGGSSTSGYVNLTGYVGFNKLSRNFTISMWFYSHGHTTTTSGIVSTGLSGMSIGSNEDKFDIWHEGIAIGGINYGFSFDKWYHVVAVVNSANASLFVNGTLVGTANIGTFDWTDATDTARIGGGSSGAVTGNWTLDEVAIWNRSLTGAEVQQLYDSGTGTFYDSFFYSITTTLETPANNYITNNTMVNFQANYTMTLDLQPDNATLYIWNSSKALINNQTEDISVLTNKTSYNYTFTLDGNYTWNVLALSVDGSYKDFGNENRTLFIDRTPPVVNQISIDNTTTKVYPKQITWNYTATESVTQLYNCYYFTSENATYTNVSCNAPNIYTNFSIEGNKNITYCANNTAGLYACNYTNFKITLLGDTAFASATEIAEGDSVIFYLYVNMTNITLTTATLNFNNTIYSSDTTNVKTDSYEFTKTLTFPFGTGNTTGLLHQWNWTYSIDGIVTNSTSDNNNLTIYALSVNNCSSGVIAYNFTIYDENNRTVLDNFLNVSANIEADLTIYSRIDDSISLQYHDEVYNHELLICIPSEVINISSYTIELVGEYSSDGHVTEFYYEENGTLSNTTIPKNIGLYDLLNADSTTFLFSYTDENGLKVDDIVVQVLRYYIGLGKYIEVERSKEDDNGEAHMHLIEEDVIYKFNVTQYGQSLFLSEPYNAKCLDTPCSIELSAQVDSEDFLTDFDNLPIGSYYIATNKASRQVTLVFNLNTTSTMNLSIYQVTTEFGKNDSVIASGQLYASSGSVVVTVPRTYDNSTYYSRVTQDGNYVDTGWVDLKENPKDYFGAIGFFMGGIMVLLFVLMGISHGELLVIWIVLAFMMMSAMYLVEMPYYLLISLICMVLILLFKIMGRQR